MTTFTVGDVVSHKTGGPLMTVENVHPEYVNIAWFDRDGRLHRDVIAPVHLQKWRAAD